MSEREDWKDCDKPFTLEDLEVRWSLREPAELGQYWAAPLEGFDSVLKDNNGVAVVEVCPGGVFYGMQNISGWIGRFWFGPKLAPPAAPK